MSEDLPSEKGKEEAQPSEKEGSSSSSRRDQMKGKSFPLDKYLTGKRGAGLADVMASARDTTEGPEARESEPVKPWIDLQLLYEVGGLVTFYDLYGYPGGVLCTQYRSTGHSTQNFFGAK
jgi:hypothetical protein